MSDAYDNVLVGKLRLKKKGLTTKSITKKKRRKKRSAALGEEEERIAKLRMIAQGESEVVEPEDPRTEMEKKMDARRAKREEEDVARLAALSHRERIEQLNEHLDSLSEHHDIPKVGPG